MYDIEPFIIGALIIEMIAATEQDPHIQIVYKTKEDQVVVSV
jgi:hypothetical protein